MGKVGPSNVIYLPTHLSAQASPSPVATKAPATKAPATIAPDPLIPSHEKEEQANAKPSTKRSKGKKKKKPELSTKRTKKAGKNKPRPKRASPPVVEVEDEAPRTPAKKAKPSAIENLPPGVRSPHRMSNNLYCYGCDHDNEEATSACEANYFTKEALAQDNYPQRCAGTCKELFSTMKINHLNRIWCCKNAINHEEHPCVWAICTRCKTIRDEEMLAKNGSSGRASRASRSSRNKRVVLEPGEKQLPNGCIIAAGR